MKKNDIVSFECGVPPKPQRGKVTWVDEENAGIILIGPDYSGQEATVIPVSDCTVVIEYKGGTLKEKIQSMETEDLKASIQRLKGMRFPRKIKRRAKVTTSPSRKQKMTRLLEVIENDPGALDTLIEKALEEDEK